jgi:Helitron helicase-like domain at N-terminus
VFLGVSKTLSSLLFAHAHFFWGAEWPEIKEALLPGQTADDRPDIVARVFSLKLQELMNDLLKRQVVGKTVAMACDNLCLHLCMCG